MSRQNGHSGITLARAQLGLPEPAWRPILQDPKISLGTLIERRAFHTRRWLSSKAYDVYADFFNYTILQSEKLEIKQAMCLGLGSLSGVEIDSNTSTHETVMMQLVAFESWINLLRKNFYIENIYLQDPVFTDLDKEFLETHGFAVIESPQSQNLISDETFLYLPGVDNFVIDSCLSFTDPGLLINAGDLGWYYRQYRTRKDIKALFESKPGEKPHFSLLQKQPDEAFELRKQYINNRAVDYKPVENPAISDESLAIYWRPTHSSECSSYDKDFPEYLTLPQACMYWTELEHKKKKEGRM